MTKGQPARRSSGACSQSWLQSRRRTLKFLGLGASSAALGPWIIKDALASGSSGQLRVMIWSDYLRDSIIQAFEQETGIRLILFPYGSNEELINKIKASKGRGADLICPSVTRAFEWRELGLTQAFDPNQIPYEAVRPDLMALSTMHWTWVDGLHHLPLFWSTEGLAWMGDALDARYPYVSYGDLWRPEFKGRVMGEAQSLLTGIGLYLDWMGIVPSERLRATYRDEAVMREVWEKIASFAIDKRDWVKLFWSDGNSQRSGFLHNGIKIGQTWNGPIMALRSEGQDITFMAPREGAMAWTDGLSLTSGARNIEQAYAFIKFVTRSDINGQLASASGRHPVSVGAEHYLWDATRRNYDSAYPFDALDSLWWMPPVPPWFAKQRARYRDEYLAAA